ncbi:unnamed protein product [Choristocarpus tenellus]
MMRQSGALMVLVAAGASTDRVSAFAGLGPSITPAGGLVDVCRGLSSCYLPYLSSRRRGQVWATRMDSSIPEGGVLKLFNTEGRSKQPLKLQTKRSVKFYSCGPTVYDAAHIGNFRAFLTYDVLKRWLLYKGFEVDHICNLTDVDDKIIQRMKRDGVGLRDLTEKYASLFFDDLTSLNIIPASKYPRATEHIDDIVNMIQVRLAQVSGEENVAGEVTVFSFLSCCCILTLEF